MTRKLSRPAVAALGLNLTSVWYTVTSATVPSHIEACTIVGKSRGNCLERSVSVDHGDAVNRDPNKVSQCSDGIKMVIYSSVVCGWHACILETEVDSAEIGKGQYVPC